MSSVMDVSEVEELIALADSVEVGLHAADREQLQQKRPELTALLSRMTSVSLVDNQSVPQGRCVIRAGAWLVEDSVGVVLESLRELALRNAKS